MDSAGKEKIEKIIRDRKAAHAELNQKSSVYRAFVGMEEKALADSALLRREKRIDCGGHFRGDQLRIVHEMAYPSGASLRRKRAAGD